MRRYSRTELDMIDLSFVQAELGIEDVQVDADPCLIANVLNTIVFTSLVDNGLCFGDLLSCTADIEVSLLYSQLYRFARSLFCFSGDEEVLFCLVDFSLCRAAVIEGIGYAGSDIPAAAIGIESGEVIVRPAVAAANGNGRLIASIGDGDVSFRFLNGKGRLEDFRTISHGVVRRFLKGNIVGIERQLVIGQVELRL